MIAYSENQMQSTKYWQELISDFSKIVELKIYEERANSLCPISQLIVPALFFTDSEQVQSATKFLL